MGQVVLFPQVLALLTVDVVQLIVLLVFVPLSISILHGWNFSHPTSQQFQLENRNIFVSQVIYLLAAIKLCLLLFFFVILQVLSEHIAGAMCASGVLNSNVAGKIALALQLVIVGIYLFLVLLNYEDFRRENYPTVLAKHRILLWLFLLSLGELIALFIFFSQIELSSVVKCCSLTFGMDTVDPLASWAPGYYWSLFIVVWGITILFERRFLFIRILGNILSLLVALGALIHFFGPYIYQLPTHNCPYCYLQQEYYYVGYLIYLLLFGGTLLSMFNGIMKISFQVEYVNLLRAAKIFKLLFLLVVHLYVAYYYIEHGTWLMPFF